MTVITITSSAKCKDCAYLGSGLNGKRKIHTCFNPKSKMYHSLITLNRLVCNEWKLIKEEEPK